MSISRPVPQALFIPPADVVDEPTRPRTSQPAPPVVFVAPAGFDE